MQVNTVILYVDSTTGDVTYVVICPVCVCSSVYSSGLWMTVVLPVTAVWTVGFFFLILVAVAKAGSRRLTKLPAC